MIDWKRLRERDTRPFYQILRYGLVGLSATLIDLLIFAGLSHLILPAIAHDLGDSVRADRSTINSAIAFFIANLYTYVINQKYVFVPGRHRPGVEFIIFVTVSAVSLLLGLWVMRRLINGYSADTYSAKLVAIGVSILINYVCRRFLVFKT